MVYGIAKDGTKNKLHYSSVALGCDFYRLIKFHFLSEWQDRWNQCSGIPFQFLLDERSNHHGGVSSDVKPYSS
jgi:hypothetical protein